MVLQETYEVIDAKWIYTGTSYITSAGVITPNSDDTYTLETDGTNYAIFFASKTNSNNTANYIKAEIGECFEFDLIEYTGAITLRSNTPTGTNQTVNNIWEANTHYKLEIIENGVKLNGVTKTFTDTGARWFILRLENNATFKIKNLRQY